MKLGKMEAAKHLPECVLNSTVEGKACRARFPCVRANMWRNQTGDEHVPDNIYTLMQQN